MIDKFNFNKFLEKYFPKETISNHVGRVIISVYYDEKKKDDVPFIFYNTEDLEKTLEEIKENNLVDKIELYFKSNHDTFATIYIKTYNQDSKNNLKEIIRTI
jgi:uncharacterized protein YlbG (UPF0298 family)